jgi:4-amino-4-deoxy-L-arabinose transferase-like glycosyltransferase
MAGEATKSLSHGEGAIRNGLILGSLFLVPLLLYVLYYKALFNGLINSNALDFAQLGRNLSEGRGFTTYFLRPLAMTHGNNLARQPDLVNAPLFPSVLALAFGIRGATDVATAFVSGAFYLLTVPVLYLLGSRVFSRNVGLIAALVFAANPLMLEYATSGMNITLYTFLMTSLLLVIYQISVYARDRVANPALPLPKSALILAGVLTGGLYLTDQIFVYIIPVIFVAVFSLTRGQTGKALLSFLVPLLILILPWMIRATRLTGNPLFGVRGFEVWMGTKDFYPSSIAYRHTPPDLIPGMGLFNAVIRKVFVGLIQVIESFPQVSASWMLAFLLPSLLFKFRDVATNSLRRVMMYCFLGVLIGMLPFGVEMPLFASLIPTMLLFAIAYLMHVLEQAKLPRMSVILFASVLGGAIFLPLIRNTIYAEKQSSLAGMTSAQILKKISQPGDVVITDQPWLVAWYADRPAIWIPAVDAKVGEYRQNVPNFKWMLLTDQTNTMSREWNQIYSAFAGWNQQYVNAKIMGQPAPSPLRISDSFYPLLEHLNGFTVIEPTPDTLPKVVLAELQPKP